MIKALKLQKALGLIILGVLTLIASQIMSNQKMTGSNFVLGTSGAFLMIGALMFLYPIFFAKKVEGEEEKVELQPLDKEPVEDRSSEIN